MSRKFREFIAADPYNPANTVEGCVCVERNRNYGSLTLKKVNGNNVDVPPIMGTPKIGYPFTREGNFRFSSAEEILCFKKYDGSNILAYRYWDEKGNPCISYKVRLWPFLRGKLIPMWNAMLSKYPAIKKLFAENPDIAAFSFELYGCEHPHLIQYENPLDTVLLFGLRRDGTLVVHPDIVADGIPKATLLKSVQKDYVWEYQQMQEEFGERLHLIDADTQMYAGDEGAVWYVKEKATGHWKMFKCKPRQIELTHWGYQSLTHEVLKSTALNILDEHSEITEAVFKEYLAEEYPPHQIEASLQRIRKMMRRMNVRGDYTEKIHELMHRYQFSASTDTRVIMRAFANHFPRNKMGNVFKELQHVLRTM